MSRCILFKNAKISTKIMPKCSFIVSETGLQRSMTFTWDYPLRITCAYKGARNVKFWERLKNLLDVTWQQLSCAMFYLKKNTFDAHAILLGENIFYPLQFYFFCVLFIQ